MTRARHSARRVVARKTGVRLLVSGAPHACVLLLRRYLSARARNATTRAQKRRYQTSAREVRTPVQLVTIICRGVPARARVTDQPNKPHGSTYARACGVVAVALIVVQGHPTNCNNTNNNNNNNDMRRGERDGALRVVINVNLDGPGRRWFVVGVVEL
jgi:hypothetical protein